MSRLLRSEWTKLWTVVGTGGCLLAVAGALIGVALLISSGSARTWGDGNHVDEFRFVHRPLGGDGTLTARVHAQEAGHPWAMAGIMVKQRAVAGAPYAALMVTTGHGVRMQADFGTDFTHLAGSPHPAPRYLRLTRAGDAVTGHESADGSAWSRVGTVTLAGLPPTVEVGMFVTSPGMTRVHPMRPALVQVRPGTATFDEVRVDPPGEAPWTAEDVGGRSAAGPAGPAGSAGSAGEAPFTVTGSGDITRRVDDGSRVVAATAGTVFAVLPAIAMGVLGITAEYRWGTIRATLAASPRRGRVLTAKAVVVAAATFPAALAATVVALLLTQPLLRRNGFGPPVYPDPAPLDPATVRVVAGTAAVLTLLALLGLGVGAVLRRATGAVTVLAATVFVPVVVTPFLPASAATWLQRVAPLAGLSVQQVRDTDDTFLLPWSGHPWHGLLVLCAYTGAVLGVAYRRLRRTDA
jgi:hypothetical protein